MHVFDTYFKEVKPQEQADRLKEIIRFIEEKFPELEPRVAWKQPMFVQEGAFIIGFSISKNHISVSPERAALDQFDADIKAAGYEQTKHLFRIKRTEEVSYDLLYKLIFFNMDYRKGSKTFWQ